MSLIGSMSKVLSVLLVVSVRSEDCPINCFCGFDAYQGVRSCLNLSQRHFNDLKYLQIPELDFRTSDNIELHPNDFAQYSDKSVYLHLSDDDVEELSAEKAVSNSTTNIFYLSGKNLTRISENVSSNCTDILCIYLDQSLIKVFHDNLFKNHPEIYDRQNITNTAYTVGLLNKELNVGLYDIYSKYRYSNGQQSIVTGLQKISELIQAGNSINKTEQLVFGNIIFKSLSYSLKNVFNNMIFYNLIFILHLDFSNKYLSIIDKNIFDNLKNLTKLDLSYNNLSIIDYMIFSQLSDLEELYMSHNILIFIDYRLFNNLEKLTKLDLSYNKIRFLDYRVFISLNWLRELHLAANSLQIIRGSLVNETAIAINFTDNNSHQMYPLNDNLLFSLQLKVFMNPYLSNRYSLTNTYSSEANYAIAFCFANITSLNVDSSTFHVFRSNISGTYLALQHLNLRGTILGSIRDIWLTSMARLENLDISQNQLVAIYPDDLESCTRLLYLNISNNLLREIHENAFSNSPNLLSLDISGNPLVHISVHLFRSIRKLNHVNAARNMLTVRNLTLVNELFELPQYPFIVIDNNPICSNRLHRTLLLLFYKTYNNEYYEYAYRGHHSCYRDLSTTSHLTVNIYNMINNNAIVNITTNMTLIECSEKESIEIRPVSEYYCPITCVCKTNIDKFGEHIRVSLGTYSKVECNDPLLKKFPDWLSPNTTHLAISHTNISNIASNYFENITNLFSVSFYRNNLQLLPYDIFQPLKHLKILDLSGNQLKTLDSKQFYYLHELESLKLDDNMLESLNDDALKGLSNLVLLNISGNRIESLQCNVLTDQHKLNTLDLSKNQFSIILPCIFKNDSQLSYINLSNNRYKEINCETFSKFSKLSELYIASNQISQISSCVFKNLSSLARLDISKNLLTSLSHSVFRPLKELLILDLNGNLITFIHNETFSELKKMTYLDLSNNHLSEVSPELFSSNIRLSVIKLSGNFLTVLDSHLLKNSEGVFEFDISSNKLLNITSTFFYRRILLFIGTKEHDIILFKYFRPSHSLNLSHNMINTIPCNLLEGKSNLKEMYQNNNNITSLCDDMLQPSNTFLAILDLSFNKLESVSPKLFQNLRSLIILNISHNNLTSLSLGLFDSFKHFLNLDLSYNKIKSLPMGLFRKLFYLKTLDLSFNLLYHLPLGLFSDMSRLNSIDLSANPILYFPATIFNRLTSLVSINLANTSVSNRDLIMFNDLYSLHNGGYKSKLEVVNIRFTLSCNIKTYTCIRKLFDNEYDRKQLLLICN